MKRERFEITWQKVLDIVFGAILLITAISFIIYRLINYTENTLYVIGISILVVAGAWTFYRWLNDWEEPE